MTPAEQITELRVTLARVEGVVTNLSNTIVEGKQQGAQVDQRLRALERFRWQLVGIASALGTAAGFLYTAVSHR